jgi:low affinity Fe/Cu permease
MKWVSAGFDRISAVLVRFTGSSGAFAGALGLVVIWALTGPLFGYSDTWQLVINTGTTVVTFLMVFLIQHAQNKDSLAMQLKLNELVAAVHGANNRLVGAEDLTDEELQVLKRHYQELARMAKDELALRSSHSVSEAHARHREKAESRSAAGEAG